jgi:hypothetical protein
VLTAAEFPTSAAEHGGSIEFARIATLRALNRHVETRVRSVAEGSLLGTPQAEAGHGMKLTHRFAELTPEKRPQEPHMDGTGLRFETTMEHGGEYPDTSLKLSS